MPSAREGDGPAGVTRRGTSGDGIDIPPMRIVMSYRRGDTAGHAGHLHADLVQRFGQDQVFLDIENILPGSDFSEVIDDAIHGSDVLLALLGKDWLTATDRNGRRRLDKGEDFVRMELEAALNRGVRVIPVLVQGAEMPDAEDLPATIKAFAKKNAFEISDRRWRADVDELIRLLEQVAHAKAKQLADRHGALEEERAREEAARRDEERREEALRQATLREQLKEQAAREQALRDQAIKERISRERLAREQAPREESSAPPARAGPGVPDRSGTSPSPRLRLPALAVLATVAVLIGIGLVALTSGPDSGTESVTRIVRSDVLWNDTGLDLEAGQALSITAIGTVETAHGDLSRNSGPDGKQGEEYLNNVLDGVRHGALIGMIGSGDPFEVGARYEKAAPGTGRLYLGVNDKGPENNRGEYTAEITVG